MGMQTAPLAFRDLPETSVLALLEWLGDGDDIRARLESASYMLTEVPVHVMKALVMSDSTLAQFGDFELYHEWYLNESDGDDLMPVYDSGPDRWPVISAGRSDEPLDDGWHRMHAYITAGDATIPFLAVEFADRDEASE